LSRLFPDLVDEEHVMKQLHCKFHWRRRPELESFGSGNEWCSTPDELPKFKSFIEASLPFSALRDNPAGRLVLDFEAV
jgi:hypothetical protein